ncbi:MAG TPA: rRNA adenine N-6-methyltransferase family protein [Gemmatimonadales bacterium]|nr:rRNA adenine N-6-methyltransferase family protein [Gemmatimonadales bacterium]
MTPPGRPPLGAELLLFGGNFFRHPRMLGSIVPSSRFLVRRVLRPIEWDRARVVVEYGPGVGTMTGHMLARMRADAMLVAFETNPAFVRYLRRVFPDPRLHVVEGSAASAPEVVRTLGAERADYVVSGIPYSTIPSAVREQILRGTHQMLDPHGRFLVYQFTRAVLPDLRRIFGAVEEGFEPRNVLPARLFSCKANGRGGAAPALAS